MSTVLLLTACYGGGGPDRTVSGGGPATLAGAPAVSYDLKRVDGTPDSLARHRGSVVVMNLWATWCPPCQAEMPALEKFAQEYKSKGVVVLGIDQGESAATAGAYARARGVTFPILLDEDEQYGGSYKSVGLPTSVIVGRDGHIVAAIDGEMTLAQMRAAVAPALKTAK
jgi:thiol-disulfide isomerase/thioredoxin